MWWRPRQKTPVIATHPHIEAEQETLASAVIYLFDDGKETLANALIQCALHLEPVIAFSTRQLWGDVSATLVGRGSAVDELMRERKTIISTIQRCLPPRVNLEKRYYYSGDDRVAFEFRGGLVPIAYQETTRRLVELGGIEVPSVRNLRIKQQGQEYALKPIPIFPIGTFERNPLLCFVIMPFAAGFQEVYEQGIRRAVEAHGLICQRGDDIYQPGDILGQIWTSLIQARLVIADLTGANGNVLYELGLAHIIGQQAILLSQDTSAVPFDLRQQRGVRYSATRDGIARLVVELDNAIEAELARQDRH